MWGEKASNWAEPRLPKTAGEQPHFRPCTVYRLRADFEMFLYIIR